MENGTKQVHIQYFALLREERGLSDETWTTQAETIADLYQELQTHHHFSLSQARLSVALNDTFEQWDKPLVTGDRIVFIPPVAGG